jgi:hypothetical protein
MFEQFVKCNNNCVQPLIYAISGLPILVILIGMIVGLLFRGKLVFSVLLISLITIIFFALIYLLLEWCCKNNLSWVGWVIVAFPYIGAFFTAFSLTQKIDMN